jgi:hypothetical protein
MVQQNHSALRELQEQLYLDTADGRMLDVVTANNGLPRPHGGFGDDEWRAIAKQIMLRDKASPDVYRRVLEVCIGPQFGRTADLAVASEIGDDILTLADASPLVQYGTLRIDPGLSVEEVVRFHIRDLVTQEVELRGSLRFPHRVVASGATYLRADAAADATTLEVVNARLMPAGPFPYSIVLDADTEGEEVVVVMARDVDSDELTVLPLERAHKGPTVLFWRTNLHVAAAASSTFLRFIPGDTRPIPAAGWLRINKGGGNAEVVEYEANDPVTGFVHLAHVLAEAHDRGESVELVRHGARIRTATVLQEGAHWDIYSSKPKKVTIYVPRAVRPLRLHDASYIHDGAPPAFSTTLAAPAAADALELSLVSVAGLPDEAALVRIAGHLVVWYLERREDLDRLILPEAIGVAFPAGTTVELYEDTYGTDIERGGLFEDGGQLRDDRYPGPYVYAPGEQAPSHIATTLAETLMPPLAIVADQPEGRTTLEVDDASLWGPCTARVGRQSGFQEDVAVSSVRRRQGVLTLVDGNHAAGSYSLAALSTDLFPQSTSSARPAGYRIIIARGLGAEEVVRVAQNNVGDDVLALETPLQLEHSNGESIELMADVLLLGAPAQEPHRIGHHVEQLVSEIEVDNASEWPTSGKAWLNFGWARHPARRRIKQVVSSTIYELATPQEQITAVRVASVIGDTQLQVEDSAFWPRGGDGVHALGYRLVIDPGGASEEVVRVMANDPGAQVVTLVALMERPHAEDEVVRLILADFPEAGPYQVLVGEGRRNQEPVEVASYDPVADRLTFAAPVTGTHSSNPGPPYIAFRPGAPEVVEYASRTSTVLALREPIILTAGHHAGEDVRLSWGEAVSRGIDYYAFKVPPDPGFCVAEIVPTDAVRARRGRGHPLSIKAAGEIVEIVNDR